MLKGINLLSLGSNGRLRVRQTGEEWINLNFPLLGDGKANPIPTELKITHPPIPVGIDLATLA